MSRRGGVAGPHGESTRGRGGPPGTASSRRARTRASRTSAVAPSREALLQLAARCLRDAWDREGRRYESPSDLRAYCARVAATVGVLMTLLLGERSAAALGRACDLGVAMQLTNIARDVGEDARRGRLYLPLAWLRDAGLCPDRFLAEPRFSPALGGVVRRLLADAARLYDRADAGIPLLPRTSRPAIQAARLVYADIGRTLRRAGHDSVEQRAVTGPARKAWLLARAIPALVGGVPPSAHEPPLEEARFLVEAATLTACPTNG